MSFVTAVRDYVDWINANFDSFHQTFGGEMTLAAFAKGTFLYLGQSLKMVFLYVFTFQWLRDLAYLPVIIPEFTLDTFRETFAGFTYRNAPAFTGLAFFGTPTLLQNKILVGVFNSFFASLPLTFAHLIAARQFYVKGWRAAAATNAGIIVGHLFFLTAVLFGWRPVLIPWLQFEPWTFVITVAITYFTIKSSFGRAAFQQMTTVEEFAKTGLVGFLLTICDQGVLFKYLSTLTGGLEPTYLEPVTGTAMTLTQQHIIYLLGFAFGSVLFTAGFFALAAGFRRVFAGLTGLSYITFASRVNTIGTIGFIAMLCMSLSFYGLDFLVTKPLGYVPYDRALVPGTFASYTLEDKQLMIRGVPEKREAFDVTQGDVAVTKKQKEQQKQKSILNQPVFPLPQDFDLASYDRGIYFRRAMASAHETRSTESYRIPTSEFWSSRTVRRKAPRGMFAKLLKVEFARADRRFFKPLQETLGLRKGEKERRDVQASEFEARLRARKIAEMRRLWLLANQGSRQKFDQFTVYDNVTSPFDPYVSRLTKEQLSLLEKMDKLLNVPRADYAANIDRIDQLIHKYETTMLDERDPPIESRFTTVEDMTSAVFEGQTERQRTSKRKLGVWPYLFAYLHEEDANKALKQRVLHERLRQNPYVITLFRTDIDAFLNRQPQDQILSSKEEAELYFKRTMLKNLAQTTAKYRRIFKRNPVLLEAFDGGKSMANKVYNHQFNGTYKVVRQLMRVDLDPMVNREGLRVMKYDMPLFSGDKDRLTSAHEELIPDLARRKSSPRQSEAGRMAGQNYLIRAGNTRPFYAGWDDDRRAFVLTNRFLPNRVSSRVMRFNENYPEFASLSALAMETKSKSTNDKNVKRIAFTTWPIASKVANDPLLSRTRPSAFMGQRPSRYDVSFPPRDELATKEGRAKRSKARSARFLIHHFLPDFDFRPLQILLEEADKPNADLKKARRAAQNRIAQLEPSELDEDMEFIKTEPWPAGFMVHRKTDNVWWLEEKPPVPFVDRGGYVWPGHEQLKINMRHYLPQWKAPALTAANPFVKE